MSPEMNIWHDPYMPRAKAMVDADQLWEEVDGPVVVVVQRE